MTNIPCCRMPIAVQVNFPDKFARQAPLTCWILDDRCLSNSGTTDLDIKNEAQKVNTATAPLVLELPHEFSAITKSEDRHGHDILRHMLSRL